MTAVHQSDIFEAKKDLVKHITDDITMVADDFRTYGDSYEASILDGVVDFILSKYGDGPADPEYIRNRMLDDATFHNTDHNTDI